MLDDKLLQLIDDTGVALELVSSVVEKDYYITQIIHALSVIENDCFRLVFAGGTCLAKAHKIIKRMSEDIDFKIQIKSMDGNFSKTKFFKELKQFRLLIKSKLISFGLAISQMVIHNEGQYSRIEIDYPSIFPVSGRLRPHILLEFTLSNIHLPIENLFIRTLIEDTLENVVIFVPSETQCISIDETGIEKWVSLTRRIIAIERAYHYDDKTLIRHLYDLNAIKYAGKIKADFFALAQTIVNNDAKQFNNQHPEYSANPSAEIRQSLVLLKTKQIWKERYQEFIETMVYEKIFIPTYESAIEILENISEKVVSNLNSFIFDSSMSEMPQLLK